MSDRDHEEKPGARSTGRLGANPHLWEIRAVRELAWLFLGLTVLSALLSMRFVLIPLLVAFLLAYLVNPLVTWMQRRLRWPRPVTVAILLGILLSATLALLLTLVPLAIDQLGRLVASLPDYLDSLAAQVELDTDELEATLRDRTERFREHPEELLTLLWKGTGRVVDFVAGIVSRTTGWLILFPLIPFYFYFLAWHYPKIVEWFGGFVPQSKKERVFTIARRMDRAVGAFFRERVFLALLMGALLAFGWKLVDVPYFFLLGLGTGVLSFIPYAANLGWPLALLVKYLEAPDAGVLEILVWPSLVFQAVLLLSELVLVPWIQRRGTNLSALTIVVAVFVGGALAGLVGLMFAIPIAACIKIFFEEVIEPRWRSWAEES